MSGFIFIHETGFHICAKEEKQSFLYNKSLCCFLLIHDYLPLCRLARHSETGLLTDMPCISISLEKKKEKKMKPDLSAQVHTKQIK